MQGFFGELVRSILDIPGAFADVATNDPPSAVLLFVGFLIIGTSSAVIGYLSLGAAVDLVTPT